MQQLATAGTLALPNELRSEGVSPALPDAGDNVGTTAQGRSGVLLVGDGPIHTLPPEMLVTLQRQGPETFAAARKAGAIQFGE